MEICNVVRNSTISNTSFTWGQVFNETIFTFTATAYLRPDKGITLIPWVFILILLVIHIPIVLIRVVRWEMIQLWCLFSALFTIIIYVQAYISTRFGPDKVLIWNPVILVIDSGSMLQVFVLIVEESRLFNRLLDTPIRKMRRIRVAVWSYIMSPKNEGDLELRSSENEPSHDNRNDDYPPILKDIALYKALAALALLLAILILQVLGTEAAARHRKSNAEPPVSYCSPGFQPFAKAILDSSCRIYDVDQSAGKGIGCINIPGRWQRDWLNWTVIGTSIAIVLQFSDFLVLCSVNSGTRWRAVKMQRPWCTMFAGLAFLGATLFFSLNYASNLPPGISEQVWVVMDTSANKPVIFSAHLTTAGLRGQVIAWFDGLLDSWGSEYYGDSI